MSQVYQGSKKRKRRFRESDWYSISVDTVRFWVTTATVLALMVALFLGYQSWRSYWVEQNAFEWVSRSEGLILQLEAMPVGAVPGLRATVQRGRQLLDDARADISDQRFADAVTSGEAAHELLEDLLVRARVGSSLAWFRSVRGDVQFRRGESGEFVRAFARSELHEGDYVMAGDGGAAEIHFRGEDTVFTLRPNTLIKLSRSLNGNVRTLGEMEYGWVALDTAEQSSGVSTANTRVVASEFSSASLELGRGSDAAVVRVEEGSATATATRSGESRQLGERQQVVQSRDRLGTTENLLTAPALIHPADGTSVNIDSRQEVELDWSGVAGASAYRLQVARGRLFAESLVDDDRSGTGARLALEQEGSFYWRVAARDGRGRLGSWSEARRLRVESYRNLAIEADEDPPFIEVEVSMNGNFAVLTGRTEPGARLSVNGEVIPTSADGTFSTTFGVPETGRVPLIFEATDLSGNSTIERREVWVDPF